MATTNTFCSAGPRVGGRSLAGEQPGDTPDDEECRGCKRISRPAHSCEPIAETLTRAMTINDVQRVWIDMPLNRISAGTMTKPPPTPKSPDSTPVRTPTPNRSMAQRLFSRSADQKRQRADSRPTGPSGAGHSGPDSAVATLLHSESRRRPSGGEQREQRFGQPTGDPSANRCSQHSRARTTGPCESRLAEFQRCKKPANDVAPTAASEMPTASAHGNRQTVNHSGTAKIAPRPRQSQRETTTAPKIS